MKSGRITGLAGAMALSCLLGAPQLAGAAVVLNGCSGGAFGDACSLAELVGGGSMVINETRFSNFSLDLFAGQALNAAVIRVDPIETRFNPGFSLADTGGTLSLTNASTLNNLGFNVSIVPGNLLWLKDSSLAMAVGNLTEDNSIAHISEQIFDETQTTLLGLGDTFCNSGIAPSCANSTLTDGGLLSATVTGLSVQALIDVVGDAAGIAQINAITMQFSQIPEPGSLALVALAFG